MNTPHSKGLVFEPYLLSVDVYLDTHINDVLFTGKLVKSLLIDANPKLREVFAKTYGTPPKLIHITPLYQNSNGRVKCLYSYAIDSADKSGREKVTRVTISSSVYRFYVGFVESATPNSFSFDELYDTLLNISGTHTFCNYVVKAELVSVEVTDARSHSRDAVRELVKSSGRMRLVFSSPTLLRDPLRSIKFKSLVPTPMNIFSTPVYILHYLVGKLTTKSLTKALIMVHRLLSEPHSYLETVKRKWIVYEKGKNPIPALIGYVNLHLNKHYYEHYSKTYNVEGMLEKLLTLLLTLGTGTSRASGFGHVELVFQSFLIAS